MGARGRKIIKVAKAALHNTAEAVKGARKQLKREAQKRRLNERLTIAAREIRDTGKAAVVAGTAAAATVVAHEMAQAVKQRARARKAAAVPAPGAPAHEVPYPGL